LGKAGGTLIGLGGALQFMADPKNNLLRFSRRTRYGDSAREAATPAAGAAAGSDTGRVPGKLLAKEEDFTKATQADGELRIRCTEYWRA